MSDIPIPSQIHYEILLQLLERQSILAVDKPQHKEQMQQLIITLRKAAVLQQQLEEDLARDGLSVEYRWTLNQTDPPVGIELPPVNIDLPHHPTSEPPNNPTNAAPGDS